MRECDRVARTIRGRVLRIRANDRATRLKHRNPPSQPLSRRHARRRQTIRRIAAFGGLVLVVALIVIGIQGWKIVSALVEAERSVVVALPTRTSDYDLGGAANSGAQRPQVTPEYMITPSAEAGEPDDAPETATVDPIVLTPRATSPVMPNVTVEPTAASTGPAADEGELSPTATLTGTGAGIAVAANATGTVAAGTGGVVGAAVTGETPEPTLTPASTPTPEPSATSTPDAPAPSPTPAPTEAPDVAAEPTQAPNQQGGGAAVAAANESSPVATSGDDGEPDDPSHLDVLQQVLGAGFDSGDPATSDVWNGDTELTILVVGVDTRAEGGDQNADVIIIANLDLINRELRAVSIPRDLLVEIPGIGFDKINSAYNYGVIADPENPAAGVAKMRDTIEYNFGIPIEHYVMIDFDGFVEVVDALGGIEVDVPYDILDEEYPTEDYGVETVFFPAGLTEMDGETALKYVRTRHADSDDQRRERQMQVILAIFEKGKSIGSLSRIDNTIVALGGSAQTSFRLEQQLTLARLALEMDSTNIIMTSLAPPLIEGGVIDTGAWVYIGDMATITAFLQEAVYGPDGSVANGAG
jgi:LCP family protein required for cell wall assembly